MNGQHKQINGIDFDSHSFVWVFFFFYLTVLLLYVMVVNFVFLMVFVIVCLFMYVCFSCFWEWGVVIVLGFYVLRLCLFIQFAHLFSKEREKIKFRVEWGGKVRKF